MTHIITDTIEQLDAFAETVSPETRWIGDLYGINLYDLLHNARRGMEERDRDLAHGLSHDNGELDDPLAGYDDMVDRNYLLREKRSVPEIY